MSTHYGDVPAGQVIYHLFDTFAGSTGASITMTGLAVTDIEVYKNGSTTQRASDAGYTLLDTDGIDFDGLTGIHGFSIDTGNNTDAGFFSVGGWYNVVVSAITVDSQTVSFVACSFRLVAAESSAGVPKVDASHFAGTAYATALAAEVDAVWDEQVDGTVTARQSVRLANSALAGKASGLATTTAVYRDLADTKDRISATVDANGNRTAVTRDVT